MATSSSLKGREQWEMTSVRRRSPPGGEFVDHCRAMLFMSGIDVASDSGLNTASSGHLFILTFPESSMSMFMVLEPGSTLAMMPDS